MIEKCKGSYIIIEPVSNDKITFIGIVAFENSNKKIQHKSTVYYHKDDFKIFTYNSKLYHIVLHYNIIIEEFLKKEETGEAKMKLEFTGMSANF